MIEAFLHGWSLRDTAAHGKAEYASFDLSAWPRELRPVRNGGLRRRTAAPIEMPRAPKGRAASFQCLNDGYSAANA
jgi:hypothetical protein